MTEESFLDAIAAAPDDEMLRLVYADWLLENGHPWADIWRKGEFCSVMGWQPWVDWQSVSHWINREHSRVGLPPGVYAYVKQHASNSDANDRWSAFKANSEAITAANRAFVLAWCGGWRPTQADCQDGALLPGSNG